MGYFGKEKNMIDAARTTGMNKDSPSILGPCYPSRGGNLFSAKGLWDIYNIIIHGPHKLSTEKSACYIWSNI